MHDRDEFRHLGHLDPRGELIADDSADGDEHHRKKPQPLPRPDQRRKHRDRHAGDAVPDRALGTFLPREPTKREDEENRRDYVGRRRKSEVHDAQPLTQDFWNMASMRRVTRKPPKMFTAAMRMPRAPRTAMSAEFEPTCISAPRMMIDEIAFVTAMSGV